MDQVEKELLEQFQKEGIALENSMTRLKRTIYGDSKGQIKTFAIISSGNPRGKAQPAEKNNKFEEAFKAEMEAGHFQYLRQIGVYGGREVSFIVFNITLSEAKFYSGKFEQESFIWGKPGKTPEGKWEIYYYETQSYSPVDYQLKDQSLATDLATDAVNYYSQKKGFKYKFRFPSFESVASSDQEALEQSVDESYTGSHRFKARIKSQR